MTPTAVPREEAPIAVVGISCRLPGASGPGEFWSLLRDGVDAVGPAPPDRCAGTGQGDRETGGFLSGVDRFDCAFFGISPREAAAMDPQQRLALELSWEAIEDAGVVPARLRESATGVWVGVMAGDYQFLQGRGGADAVTRHTQTGLARGLVANRISYFLGVRGPSLVVDTAQSSSLVAVHLACESLRSGESAVALAGGVHLNLAEDSAVAAVEFGGLSGDSRCFTFDERANGYVRGEGGGFVVLKPLPSAVADGDRIYCVLTGSAVNNDGPASTLTTPDADAQTAVIRRAHQRAGTVPEAVQYVELHGSGTPVGDPVEAAALGAALGTGRGADAPLRVGSVKTNIGHLEGAAGIAGLIKTALSIRFRELPPSLHFERPNPEIPLAELGLSVQRAPTPWPRPGRPLVAGVSSFGIGGTNCHVVLSEFARREHGTGAADISALPFVLSAASARAVGAQAARLAEHVRAHPEAELADLGHSLVASRALFEHRAVVVAERREDLTRELDLLADGGTPSARTASGTADLDGVVFVFPGQGTQWLGMADELCESSEVFRRTLDDCAAALAPHVDWSLRDVLSGVRGAPSLDRVEIVQPALFAMMVSLAALWRSYGVRPAAIVGHSQGEVAAACVAGVLSLAEAARVVALRGKAMRALVGLGGMAAVSLPVDEAERRLTDRLEIAAVNGPRSVTVSGDDRALGELLDRLAGENVRARRIPVDCPGHSRHVDVIEERIRADLGEVTTRPGPVPMLSTVTGRWLDGGALESAYWFRNARETVLFGPAISAMVGEGYRIFVEMGPHPALAAGIGEVLEEAGADGVVLESLRRGNGGLGQILTSVAGGHVRGMAVDWTPAFGAHRPRRIALPTYAFQRRRCWLPRVPELRRTPEDTRLWDAVERSDLAEAAAALGVDPVRATFGETVAALKVWRQGGGSDDLGEDAVECDEPEREDDWGAKALEAGAEERFALALDLVRAEASVVLGLGSAEEVVRSRTFRDLGFDSLGSAELRNRLTRRTGLRLPSSLSFDHPTAEQVAGRLCDELLIQRKPIGQAETGEPAASAPVAVAPEGGGRTMAEDEKLRSYLNHVVTELRSAKRRLDEFEAGARERVAVVGMACRYPGGIGSPEDLWDVVSAGRETVGEFPADRGWDLDALYDPDLVRAGTTYARGGSFLYDAADFDAGFFGISPREALAMDPQQRLSLETVWQLLERAGVDPATLRGSRTGVFTGLLYHDYAPPISVLPKELEGLSLTGTTGSVASGRISYTFGFEGPSMTVDTACSSSLVALHLGAQALRRGECDLVVAGGVTVMATPGTFVEFARQRGLSADGRCRSFSASADGTGWAEGAGFLLLERLSDARRNGHRVLAVLAGSAVNSDGTSNGLTAPHGPSQERVIRAALADARVTPSEVDAVEAHGTGTRLGDPIEANALLATYGQDRGAGDPLWLGSLKSNIGHTQGAAGVGGVLKMIMALRHGILPATLHVDEPSPEIEWDSGAVRLLTEPREWPASPDRPRRAGVSSFGISGTNAHLIVEEAPAETGSGVVSPEDGTAVALLVSGRSEDALRAQATALSTWLERRPEVPPADVAWSLLTTRSAFEHRAVVLGTDRRHLLAGLAGLAGIAGGSGEHAIAGRARADSAGKTVFVFPGQGSQWAGMAVDLLASSPVFAERMAECERALAPWTEWSLSEVLRAPANSGYWQRVDVVQPVLFAVMVSLAALWRAHGVVPDAVAGHSQGEIAAACVAGALSVEDAARVVAVRSRILTALAGGGGMASVALPADDLRERLGGWDGLLSVAAVNGPSSTVVSGDPVALGELLAECARARIWAKQVPVDYASHSSQVDGVRDELLARLAGITPLATETTFYSTVDCGAVDTALLDAGYWYRNLRETVELARTTDRLVADGYQVFVECSPHPVLAHELDAMVAERNGFVVGSLSRDDGSHRRFLASLAQVHVRGVEVDWTPSIAPAAVVDLPTYAFQRTRYWFTPDVVAAARAAGTVALDHPVLGAELALADGAGTVFTGRITTETGHWLTDHAVRGTVLLPGTAFVEFASYAGRRVGCDRLDELTIETPLILRADEAVQIQLVVGPGDAGCRPVRCYSRQGTEEWVRHATGSVRDRAPEPPVALDWPPADAVEVEVTGAYARLAERGYDYGPAFQGLRRMWRRGDEIFAEVALPGGGYEVLHPALLDSALHALVLADAEDGATELDLPFSWEGVSLHATGASAVRVRLTRLDKGTVSATITDDGGAVVASVDSLVLRPVSAADLVVPGTGTVLEPVWRPVRTTAPAPAGLAVVGDVPEGPRSWVRSGANVHADLDELRAAATIPEFVLVAAPGTDAGVREAVGRTGELVRTWLADTRLAETRLVFLTRSAVWAADGDEPPDPAGAAVWGLLRSVQSEHPGRFVLADLDSAGECGGAVAAALGTGEAQFAIRAGTVLVPRLARATSAGSPGRPVFDGDGTVLVTGATGMLGALLARHLVAEHGVRHLLLASRQGRDADSAAELHDDLVALGAKPVFAACDVSDRDSVADLLAAVPPEHPLVGVVHTAGVLDDCLIGTMTDERIDRVLRPKADAALVLRDLTRDADLRAFVLCSSLAGLLGTAGQGNYAAANAFLDALAQRWRADGLPATSIAWGLWEQRSRMTEKLTETDLGRLRRSGLLPLDSPSGLALFDAALAGKRAVVAAARLDWAGLRGPGGSPMLHDLAPARPVRQEPLADNESWTERLAGVPATERERLLLRLVRSEVATVLGYGAAEEIVPDRSVQDLGFSSLSAVELRNRLSERTGLRLPTTLVFDHPTAAALVRYLSARVAPEDAVPEPVPVTEELDELEKKLTGVQLDEDTEAAVIIRLRAILSQLGASDIDLSTDEEVFSLIDSEFGRP